MDKKVETGTGTIKLLRKKGKGAPKGNIREMLLATQAVLVKQLMATM